MSDRQPDNNQTANPVVVEDPEDYARTQQLKAVFDARQQFITLHGDFSWQNGARGKQSRRGASVVFTALQEFIMAVTPLLSAAGTHEDLLENKEYHVPGTATVNQIPSFEQAQSVAQYEMKQRFGDYYGLQDNNGQIRGDRLNRQQRQEIRMIAAQNLGLFSGVTLEGIRVFAEKELQLAVPRGNGWVTQAPPIETSVNVFTDCQQALSELGLGFDLTENEGDAGFAYSDLLQNGKDSQPEPPEFDGGDD